MVLNNKPQMFTVYFPSNFWYEDVKEAWNPIISKMRLPYDNVCDFMNAQIQAVTFPGASLETSMQQREQYEVTYRGGKELEVFLNKTIRLTFKLTESYLSYWIIWDQIDKHLHYGNIMKDREYRPIWMEPIKIGFLEDNGLQMFESTFYEITPSDLSELNLSYAATVAQFNTFSWSLKFNRMEITPVNHK